MNLYQRTKNNAQMFNNQIQRDINVYKRYDG